MSVRWQGVFSKEQKPPVSDAFVQLPDWPGMDWAKMVSMILSFSETKGLEVAVQFVPGDYDQFGRRVNVWLDAYTDSDDESMQIACDALVLGARDLIAPYKNEVRIRRDFGLMREQIIEAVRDAGLNIIGVDEWGRRQLEKQKVAV